MWPFRSKKTQDGDSPDLAAPLTRPYDLATDQDWSARSRPQQTPPAMRQAQDQIEQAMRQRLTERQAADSMQQPVLPPSAPPPPIRGNDANLGYLYTGTPKVRSDRQEAYWRSQDHDK
jgi:hypothetical protein